MQAKESEEESQEKEEISLMGGVGTLKVSTPYILRGVFVMKARIDSDICIGCGLCVQACPGVFRMESDKAITHVDMVPKSVEGTCRQAADDCPVTAIIIE